VARAGKRKARDKRSSQHENLLIGPTLLGAPKAPSNCQEEGNLFRHILATNSNTHPKLPSTLASPLDLSLLPYGRPCPIPRPLHVPYQKGKTYHQYGR
jgi:hypothetical protein